MITNTLKKPAVHDEASESLVPKLQLGPLARYFDEAKQAEQRQAEQQRLKRLSTAHASPQYGYD